MKKFDDYFFHQWKDIKKGNPGSERQRLPARLLPNGKSQSFKRRYFHCHPGYKGQESTDDNQLLLFMEEFPEVTVERIE